MNMKLLILTLMTCLTIGCSSGGGPGSANQLPLPSGPSGPLVFYPSLSGRLFFPNISASSNSIYFTVIVDYTVSYLDDYTVSYVYLSNQYEACRGGISDLSVDVPSCTMQTPFQIVDNDTGITCQVRAEITSGNVQPNGTTSQYSIQIFAPTLTRNNLQQDPSCSQWNGSYSYDMNSFIVHSTLHDSHSSPYSNGEYYFYGAFAPI